MDTPEQPDLQAAPPLSVQPETAPVKPLTWSGLDVLLVAGATFGSMVVCSLFALAIAGRFHPGVPATELAKSPLLLVSAQTGAFLVALFFTVVLIRARTRQPLLKATSFALPQRPNPLVLLVAGAALASLVTVISQYLPVPPNLPIQQYFRDPRSAYVMLAYGVLVAPFFEELFFRGLLFPVLERRIGLVAAVVINAACFALLHQGQLASAWAPLLLLFIVGSVFTLVRARTGSTGAAWLMHVAYNSALFAMLYIGTNGFKNFDKM